LPALRLLLRTSPSHMQLPGRLRGTTLGDLLGVLHRAGATGTLELAEDRGRTHRVHVARGLVVAVELDGAAPSLADVLRRERAADDDVIKRSLLRAMAAGRLHGEVLVREFLLSPEVVDRALRRQLLARLSALESVAEARVAFRVTVRPPRGALHEAPLGPGEFLHGRRRAREQGSPPPPAASSGPAYRRPAQTCGDWRPQSGSRSERETASKATTRAWTVLGVPPGTAPEEIKRAYRRLARSFHPDLHPGATDDERRALEARFAEVTDAYRALVA
jgi:hypothetical protein